MSNWTTIIHISTTEYGYKYYDTDRNIDMDTDINIDKDTNVCMDIYGYR